MYECFERFHNAGTGLYGLFFVISNGPDPQTSLMNAADQTTIIEIFQLFGNQLLEYVYFVLEGIVLLYLL